MSLKENTSYQKMSAVLPSAIKSAYQTASKLPSKKSVDVSQYSNIMNKMTGINQSGGLKEGTKTPLGAVTTSFMGSTKYEPGGTHKGIDIANSMGTPIPAYSGGKVTEVVSGKKQGDPAYGNYIKIIDNQGKEWRYSHLYGEYVKVGDEIKPGQVIGSMGNTGQTYSTSGGDASHLDLRVFDTFKKLFVDPSAYINV